MEPPRRERRRAADEDRLTRARRREREPAAKAAPTSDPIFTRPYEPGTAPPPSPSAKPAAPQERRERQVAALLGGFVRKPS